MKIARYEIDGAVHYGVLDGETLRRLPGSPFEQAEPTGATDAQVGRVEIGGDHRPERTEGVEALADQQRALVHLGPLDDPLRYVVGAGVAEDMVERALGRNAPARAAYDDRKFRLEMHVLALPRIDDRLVRPITVVDGFMKMSGISGVFPPISLMCAT